MSHEEQQKDELDVLSAIYQDDFVCKFHIEILCSFESSTFFPKIFYLVLQGDGPQFSLTLTSEQNEDNTEEDNCKC